VIDTVEHEASPTSALSARAHPDPALHCHTVITRGAMDRDLHVDRAPVANRSQTTPHDMHRSIPCTSDMRCSRVSILVHRFGFGRCAEATGNRFQPRGGAHPIRPERLQNCRPSEPATGTTRRSIAAPQPLEAVVRLTGTRATVWRAGGDASMVGEACLTRRLNGRRGPWRSGCPTRTISDRIISAACRTARRSPLSTVVRWSGVSALRCRNA